jgi:uncharacterized protein (DUF305 family)/predicted aspartyl protease
MRRMGLFRTTIEVESLDRRAHLVVPDALVDTGSEYTWVPRQVLESLGIRTERTLAFIVADGRRLERDIGYALIRAGGNEAPDLVVFAEPGDLILLGAHSLEGLNLKVDPLRKQLVPAGPVITAGGRTMTSTNRKRTLRNAFLVVLLGVAAAPAHAQQHTHAGMGPIVIPKGALYTEADVRFMQGMIAHHAQAIYMSRLAAAHQAGPRLLRFARKIDQSQIAEIVLMQEWLRANQQVAPDTSSWRTMPMPGMLTAEQLATLEAAHGAEFDVRFLTLMIQHHQGALQMVADLHASPRAAQDVDVSVLASDIQVVQTAEIGVMRQMLSDIQP